MAPASAANKRPSSRPVNKPGPKGKSVLLHEYYSAQDDHIRCGVYTDPLEMHAFIELERLQPDVTVTRQEILNTLETAGIIHGRDIECIQFFVEELNRGAEKLGLFEVAQGTPARPGRNGHLEYFVRPSGEQAELDTDEQGNVDHRELNLFQNVCKGQVVALIHEPTEGEIGMNVLGETLPTESGKPLAVRIGKGLEAGEDERSLVATMDGRLVHDEDRVEITDVYEVNGDVDFHTGNIRFFGSVVIHGGVQDEFKVYGRKGVRIRGVAGSCEIESDGDVAVEGGMNGRGDGRIVCGGNLYAKYVNETIVDVRGDIEIRKEILNSTVRCSGTLRVPEGTIVSGKIVALRGIQAGVIGNPLGTPVNVAAGINSHTEKRIQGLNDRINETERKIDKIAEDLAPVLEDRRKLFQLSKDERLAMEDVLVRLKGFRESLKKMFSERLRCHMIRPDQAIPQINVVKRLYTGVMVRFPSLQAYIPQAHRGPITVLEDAKKDSVRVVPMRELPKPDPEDDLLGEDESTPTGAAEEN